MGLKGTMIREMSRVTQRGSGLPESSQTVLREAIAAIRESTSGLRSDFREFSSEVKATLRVVCDPVTGYVPRSEFSERSEALRHEFWAANETSRVAMESRTRELVISLRWSIGIVITALALALSIGGFLGFSSRVFHP
jgi:hypothetical protein